MTDTGLPEEHLLLKMDISKQTKAKQPLGVAEKTHQQSKAETKTKDPSTTVPHQNVASHQVPCFPTMHTDTPDTLSS